MVRKVTQAKFESWIAEGTNEEDFLASIAGGLTLQKASLRVKQPFNCLHAHFHATPERQAKYDAARKAWADGQMDEAHEIADEVVADRDEVAKAKLRIETRLSQAKAYNRERWGERLQVEKSVNISVDAAPATRFLREQMARLEAKDVEIVEVPALPLKADSAA